jgi:hypothetical protein
MEGAMLKQNLWSNSVSRVELDQRARDARLRLEQLERLLVPRAGVSGSWLRLRRAVYLFSFGEARQGHRTRGPLSNRRSSRLPKIQQDGLEVCGSVCCA